MNFQERKALAAQRLANPDLYLKQAEQTEQAEQAEQIRNEAAEARLIDRGLLAWWA